MQDLLTYISFSSFVSSLLHNLQLHALDMSLFCCCLSRIYICTEPQTQKRLAASLSQLINDAATTLMYHD
jgi:hypothetical protein